MRQPGENAAPAADLPPGAQARLLLRAARQASLATAPDGQPFVSLVTPATAPDLGLLLLLSDLSEHTRHLRADARCALLVVGAATDASPQTAPRVTVTGLAEPIADAALKARYLAVHPYAAIYADFGDFHLWRIRPMGALLVAGFARAHRLRQAELLPDPDAANAVAAAAESIINHCNADHADSLRQLAQGAGGEAGDWAMVGVDIDGCDLACAERVIRIPWHGMAKNAADIRSLLVGQLRDLRSASG